MLDKVNLKDVKALRGILEYRYLFVILINNRKILIRIDRLESQNTFLSNQLGEFQFAYANKQTELDNSLKENGVLKKTVRRLQEEIILMKTKIFSLESLSTGSNSLASQKSISEDKSPVLHLCTTDEPETKSPPSKRIWNYSQSLCDPTSPTFEEVKVQAGFKKENLDLKQMGSIFELSYEDEPELDNDMCLKPPFALSDTVDEKRPAANHTQSLIDLKKAISANEAHDQDDEIIDHKEAERPRDRLNSSKFLYKENVFRPKRLFETFCVLGVGDESIKRLFNNKELEAATKFWAGKELLFRGKTLYDYADNNSGFEKLEFIEDLRYFVAPRGFRVQLIKDPEQIEEICRKTLFKASRNYKRRSLITFEALCKPTDKWDVYVESINPTNKLYAMTVMTRDYKILREPKNKELFIYTDVAFSFITHYPLPHLFTDLIKSVLNLLRNHRKEHYLKFSEPEYRKLIDFSFVGRIWQREIRPFLDNLLIEGLPQPSKCLKYNSHGNQSPELDIVSYKFPSQKDAWIETMSWNSLGVFLSLGLDDIVWLLSVIYAEKSPLVFFSADLTKLTSTIHTLIGLMYPIKYGHKFAQAVPRKAFGLLGSPFPAILGMNMNEAAFWRQNLISYDREKPDMPNVYVFLDEGKVFYDKGRLGSLPLVSFIRSEVRDSYLKLGVEGFKLKYFENLGKLKNYKNKVCLFSSKEMSDSPYVKNKDAQIEAVKEIFRAFCEANKKKIIAPVEKILEVKGDKMKSEEIKLVIKELVPEKESRDFYFSFKDTVIFSNPEECIIKS